MCGIMGAWPITPSVARMLPIIGLEMETRGRDAWGASNGETVIRHVGPLVDTWHKNYEEIMAWKAGIFHTRGASHGSPKKLENAHPFQFEKPDGTSVIGIHNGIINNHQELDKKYGRNFEVDSMHLWKSRADGKPWDDMEGWGNLAWWETVQEEDGPHCDMHLARFNNSSLELFQLEGGEWIFASTQTPVRISAKLIGNPVKFYQHLEEYMEYIIREDPADGNKPKLWKVGPLPFPRPQVYGASAHLASRGGTSRLPAAPSSCAPSIPWEICIKCGSRFVDRDKAIICDSCLLSFIKDYEKETNGGKRIFL